MNVTLFERIEAVLARHDIVPKPDGDDLATGLCCGVVGAKLRITETDGMLRCLISLPIFVPDYQRLAVAETICRINYGLYSGALEMDMTDGELRFRNVLPILDSQPTDSQLDWLVFWSWGFVRRYAMALLEVAVGACEPEVAVAKIEQGGRQMLLEEASE